MLKKNQKENFGVPIKCLSLINKLKKKKMDRKLLNKKKFKVKGILYGNKTKVKPLKNVAKYLDFSPQVLELNNGPISKLAYDKNLKATISKRRLTQVKGQTWYAIYKGTTQIVFEDIRHSNDKIWNLDLDWRSIEISGICSLTSEVRTALYYLLNFYEDFAVKYGHRDLVTEYFENNFFSQKEFLVNFLSRKQGKRWGGRFKKFIENNRKNFVVDAFKSTKKGRGRVTPVELMRKKQRELQRLIDDKNLASKISQEYQKLEEENEKKVIKIKNERQLQFELDRIFSPYMLPKVD